MTIGFEGPAYLGAPSPQPPGTYTTLGSYSESGMNFWNPYGEANLALIGAGLSGDPNDGTAHLDITQGADLRFSLAPVAYFGLVSFDAADENIINLPGETLEVIGYYAMGVRVTNYFTVDSLADRRANNLPDFETFYLSSQFQNVYQVDVLTSEWSVDNVVISGVPEPSCSALIVLATLCGLGRARMRGRRTQ